MPVPVTLLTYQDGATEVGGEAVQRACVEHAVHLQEKGELAIECMYSIGENRDEEAPT